MVTAVRASFFFSVRFKVIFRDSFFLSTHGFGSDLVPRLCMFDSFFFFFAFLFVTLKYLLFDSQFYMAKENENTELTVTNKLHT